jgi:hypothetical protein
MSKKSTMITVLNEAIRVTEDDYFSLTDMLRSKDGQFFISDWLINRNAIEFLGIWERVRNPNFNDGEFAIIASRAGLNDIIGINPVDFHGIRPHHPGERVALLHATAIEQLRLLTRDTGIQGLNGGAE